MPDGTNLASGSAPILEAASEYVAAGIAVFPCIEGGKKPAVAGGYKAATKDRMQVEKWWQESPGFNLAICPEDAGWCVVDVDAGGIEQWNKLAEEHKVPATYTIRTPSGGFHFYFAGSLPATVGKLGPKIDTRGRGSYVLIPPSLIGGKPYSVEHDVDVAPVPAWIREAAEAHTAAPAAPPVPIEPDLPENIGRARRRLEDRVASGSVAVQEQGGDNLTFQVACELLDLGSSPEGALDLLEEVWNPACVPPWSPEELAMKMANACRYRQNAPGAWAVEPLVKAFANSELVKAAAEAAYPAPIAAFLAKHPNSKLIPQFTEDDLPVLDGMELVEDFIISGSIVIVYGKPGSGKTFWVLDLAITIAAGMKWNGLEVEGGGVAYFVAEGLRLFKNRIVAWRKRHNLEGVKLPFAWYPTAGMLRGPGAPECVRQMIEIIKVQSEMQAAGVKLVIVDTLASALNGGNENTSEDMSPLIDHAKQIAAETGAAVLLIHHCGKDEARGARGWSGLQAALDTEVEVSKAGPDGYHMAEATKQRDLEDGTRYTFKLRPLGLGQNKRGKPKGSCYVEHGPIYGPGTPHAKRLPPEAQWALEILGTVIAAAEDRRGYSGVPTGVPSISEEHWKNAFHSKAPETKAGRSEAAKRMAFTRSSKVLVEAGRIGKAGERVWLT